MASDATGHGHVFNNLITTTPKWYVSVALKVFSFHPNYFPSQSFVTSVSNLSIIILDNVAEQEPQSYLTSGF